MAKMKITVLERMFNKDLADKYCQPDTTPCSSFTDEQEFVVENLNQPESFCAWAWNDLHKVLLTLKSAGNFSPWMKDKNTIIACCTDGIRPVVFKVERIEE